MSLLKRATPARWDGRLNGLLDVNQNNVYYNPELLQALTDARAGTCTANAAGYKANYTDKGINPCNVNNDPVLLDQMLAGLNLNLNTAGATGTGNFGAVGTVNAAGSFSIGRPAYAAERHLPEQSLLGVSTALPTA